MKRLFLLKSKIDQASSVSMTFAKRSKSVYLHPKDLSKGSFKRKIKISKAMDTKFGVSIVEKLSTLHLIAIL
jgi:hypothetical protein